MLAEPRTPPDTIERMTTAAAELVFDRFNAATFEIARDDAAQILAAALKGADRTPEDILDRRQFDLAFTGLEVGVRYAQEDLAKIRNQVLRLRHDWRDAGVGVREGMDRLLNELDGVTADIGAVVTRARPL